MKLKIVPGLFVIAVPYVFVYLIYIGFRHFIPGVSFTSHRDGLGAAIATYAGTMVAILIAAMTFLLGSKARKVSQLKQYGYMTSIVIMYGLSFVELGILFFTGILLISSMQGYLLPTIAIGIAVASFMHICMLSIQLYNLTQDE